MDIISHGLWAGAAYKELNRRNALRRAQGLTTQKAFSLWAAAFWGIFPDLFAFAVPAIWLGWQIVFGHLDVSTYPRPGSGQPPPSDAFWPFRLAHQLYNLSHSAVVFFVVFGVVILLLRITNISELRITHNVKELRFIRNSTTFVMRSVPWEMGGWLLHILIDIPTHSYKFYPTPIFWPVWNWKFLYGFSWGVPWFLIANYAAIILVYWLLCRKKTMR